MGTREKQRLWNRLAAFGAFGASPPPLLSEDGVEGPKTRAAYVVAETQQGVTWFEKTYPSKYVIDSLANVTPKLLGMLQKKAGCMPIAWGRYLGQIRPAEITALRDLGVKLFGVDNGPVNNRSLLGTQKDGEREGAKAVANLRLLNGATDLVFLDVEGERIITPLFFVGWSRTVEQAGFRPAVYLPSYRYGLHGREQWEAIHKAIDLGAPCVATWASFYQGQTQAEVDSGSSEYFPRKYNEAAGAGPFGPNVLWQDIGNAHGGTVDFNRLNPLVNFVF